MQLGPRAIISCPASVLIVGLLFAEAYAHFTFNLLGFEGARLAGYTIAPAILLLIGLIAGMVGAVFDKRADDAWLEQRKAELGLLAVAPQPQSQPQSKRRRLFGR